jgi:signal transduction histidine kinase
VILERAVVALVGMDDGACEPVAAALRAEGADVRSAIANVSALALFSVPGFDAAVLDIGEDPDPFLGLVASIRDDPRTRSMPLFVLAPAEMPSGRLAGLGPIHIIPAGNLAMLAHGVSDAIVQNRVGSEAVERARGLEERLRGALVRLSTLRSEAQTFTHDARVLCGVISGFAANLRDGIAGPMDATLRGHVAQILEAANDTAAMVHRFGGAARAHTDLAGEAASVAPMSPRTVRRTLFDLVEVTRSTMQLFETVAEQKSIATVFEGPEPVSLWGDAMQIKQVITNLLVNALKFTPPGGLIKVGVRAVAPKGTAAGIAARQQAELMVLDTGPGIPREERERVFERGVRLARDERMPGAGAGLAVVREIVSAHGGAASAVEAPGGGAALVIHLPLDMRSRREPGVLLIDDETAAHRIIETLRSRRDWPREAPRSDGDSIGAALRACRAVVIVPQGDKTALDELIVG